MGFNHMIHLTLGGQLQMDNQCKVDQQSVSLCKSIELTYSVYVIFLIMLGYLY